MGSCCIKEEVFEVEEELFDPTDFLKVSLDGSGGLDRGGDKSPVQSVGYSGEPFAESPEQEMVQSINSSEFKGSEAQNESAPGAPDAVNSCSQRVIESSISNDN